MANNRTISQLEAEGYPWIGCECCKGTVWVPFRMIREKLPNLSAMTLDELGAKCAAINAGSGRSDITLQTRAIRLGLCELLNKGAAPGRATRGCKTNPYS